MTVPDPLQRICGCRWRTESLSAGRNSSPRFPDPEEEWSGPTCSGDLTGDLRKRTVEPSSIFKSVGFDEHFVDFAAPGTDKATAVLSSIFRYDFLFLR